MRTIPSSPSALSGAVFRDALDAKLVAEARRAAAAGSGRHDASARELMVRARRIATAVAGRLLTSEADREEVVSETLLVFWRRGVQDFDPARGTLGAYVGHIAHGRAYNLIRNQSTAHGALDRLAEDPGAFPAPPQPAEVLAARGADAAASAEVTARVARLTPLERQAITLVKLEERPHAEVAKLLRLQPRQVNNACGRGMEKLRKGARRVA
ncbi:MAG: sigma-70 family RNA polymerase sigma factor [Anaeromyxobacter sp.]